MAIGMATLTRIEMIVRTIMSSIIVKPCAVLGLFIVSPSTTLPEPSSEGGESGDTNLFLPSPPLQGRGVPEATVVAEGG